MQPALLTIIYTLHDGSVSKENVFINIPAFSTKTTPLYSPFTWQGMRYKSQTFCTCMHVSACAHTWECVCVGGWLGCRVGGCACVTRVQKLKSPWQLQPPLSSLQPLPPKPMNSGQIDCWTISYHKGLFHPVELVVNFLLRLIKQTEFIVSSAWYCYMGSPC